MWLEVVRGAGVTGVSLPGSTACFLNRFAATLSVAAAARVSGHAGHAQRGARERLEPGPGDRAGAALAHAVEARVEALEHVLDLGQDGGGVSGLHGVLQLLGPL